MNTEMDVEAIVYKHMAPFFKELERRLESLLPSQVKNDAESPQKQHNVALSIDVARILIGLEALQARVHSLEEKDQYKERSPQTVADFERSQSLNALNQKADSNAKCSSETLRPDPNWAWFDTSKWDQKPTPADLESEILKAFMHWLRTPEDDARTPNFPDVQSKFRFLAFKAGVKFGQSKPLPKSTL